MKRKPPRIAMNNGSFLIIRPETSFGTKPGALVGRYDKPASLLKAGLGRQNPVVTYDAKFIEEEFHGLSNDWLNFMGRSGSRSEETEFKSEYDRIVGEETR